MIILGIDPSINNVGLALYNTDSQILKTHVFHPKRPASIANIGVQIARFIIISFLQGEKRPDALVIEYPEWQNSERGIIAMQQGFTLDLAFVVGFLCGSLGIKASACYTPTPSQWKGNLPKKAVGLRFERRFLVSTKNLTDHEFESAMMIDWYLKNNKRNL